MAPTVFVTGASGFVGSHVVKALLERGYNVKGAARGSKAEYMKKSADKSSNRLQVVETTDLAKDNLADALQGVDALIHVAAPLPGITPLDEIIPTAIESCLNIIRQAEKAGVRHVVVTSSAAAIQNSKGSLANDAFNPITKEEALASGDPLKVYSASKKYAELVIWEWAEANPHVEVTIIYPPWVFGPYIHDFFKALPDGLGTNKYLYGILSPQGSFPSGSFYVDVRDLATAHVNALESPPTSSVGRKRIVFGYPYPLDGRKSLRYLEEKRPQLKSRLNQKELEASPVEKYPIDLNRIEEVLGMKEGDFHSLEQTILDAVDDYISLEEDWIKQGLDVTFKLELRGLVKD